MYWNFQRLNNQKVSSVFNCSHLWNDPVNLLDLCQLKISKICHHISLFTHIVNFPVSFCSSDVIVTCLLTRQQLFTVWSNVDSAKSTSFQIRRASWQQNGRNIEYVFNSTLIMITVYVLVYHFSQATYIA